LIERSLKNRLRMTEATRERLIQAAMRLFGEKGYLATSVAEILQQAGANSGSLYHYFPTKQDLLIAVLERYREGLYPMLLEPAWRGIADPLDRIFALLRAYRRLLEATQCAYGCPIGSLALELHEPDPPVRERLAANFDGWTAAIERCLAEAGDRLPANVDRRDLATFVLTTMEGGVMLARTRRSLESFDAAVRQLRQHVDALQSSAAVSRRRPRPDRAGSSKERSR
jgi:TetR/AcrR family transcriptional regulator, transcriptional repressor for nem operon